MEKYRNNEFIREPLQIKQYRSLEKETRPKLAQAINAQLHKVLSKEFISLLINYANNHNILPQKSLAKELTDEQLKETQLNNFVQENLNSNHVLSENSEESIAIYAVILALLIQAIEKGLEIDKINFLNRLKALNLKEIQPIIENTSLKISLKNKEVLKYLDNYSLELVKGLNKTHKEKIKKFLVKKIMEQKTVDEIANELSTLELMNKRRAYTIVRTELMNAKAFENRYWLQKRGIKKWTWSCNRPQDHECLVNCGVTRTIGEPFPSGHTSPTVHPNCQCITEGYIPDPTNKIDINVWMLAILAGYDWTGE